MYLFVWLYHSRSIEVVGKRCVRLRYFESIIRAQQEITKPCTIIWYVQPFLLGIPQSRWNFFITSMGNISRQKVKGSSCKWNDIIKKCYSRLISNINLFCTVKYVAIDQDLWNIVRFCQLCYCRWLKNLKTFNEAETIITFSIMHIRLICLFRLIYHYLEKKAVT